MTDELTEPDEDELARRRKSWVVLVGVLLAVIVVSAVVLFREAFGGSPQSDAGPVRSASSDASHSPTPTKRAVAERLPGDDGNALAALNRYRATHSLPAVKGAVSPAAQHCASGRGAQARCPSPYYWEPVEAADGKAVIAKIAAHSGGADWLLDRSMTAVQIGWAHGSDGLHLCALIKMTR